MTLKSIIDSSSIFTDEKFSDADLISLANTCISKINTDCNTLFPDYRSVNEEYNAFPSQWQLSIISPYLSYGIKMNDSSLTEAQIYLDEFYKALSIFKDRLGSLVDKYNNGDKTNGVSSEYIDEDGFGGVYGIDTSGAINMGFFGDMGNGGSF